MIVNKTTLEVKKEDRTYVLTCEPNSPLGEIFDVLSTMKAFVISKMQESEKKPSSEIAESVVEPTEIN